MTRTNAKIGMIHYKKGFGKEGFDYDFVQEAGFSESETMGEVVSGLRADDKRQREAHRDLDAQINELKEKNTALEQRLANMEADIKGVVAKYHEALKGVLSR